MYIRYKIKLKHEVVFEHNRNEEFKSIFVMINFLDCLFKQFYNYLDKEMGKAYKGWIITLSRLLVAVSNKIWHYSVEIALSPLVLSWHFKDSLLPKMKQAGYEGKFIVPLPVPKIL